MTTEKIDRLRKLGSVILELKQKVKIYGFEYGRTGSEDWYTKRKYAQEGLKMARQEFSRLSRQYRKEKGYDVQI